MTVNEASLTIIAVMLFVILLLIAAIVAGTAGPRSVFIRASEWTLVQIVKAVAYPPMWLFAQLMKVLRLPFYAVQFLFRPLMRYSQLAVPLQRAGWIALYSYALAVGVALSIGVILLFWAALSLAVCGFLPSPQAPLSCFQNGEM